MAIPCCFESITEPDVQTTEATHRGRKSAENQSELTIETCDHWRGKVTISRVGERCTSFYKAIIELSKLKSQSKHIIEVKIKAYSYTNTNFIQRIQRHGKTIRKRL